MYETDALPVDWLRYLDYVDEILVPSTFCAEVFGRATTRRPIHVVPLGVNAKDFPAHRRTRGDKLRVLHFATHGSEVRKGADLAVAAFLAAFGDRTDVEPVLRSSFPPPFVGKGDPRIQRLCGTMPTASLNALYRSADVLLYPSRGEGFGMIPLEAMATGLPTIYPASTGMLDYAKFGLTVGAYPIAATVGHGAANREALQVPWGHWFEPAHDELVDRLRQVDADYDAVHKRAAADAKKISADWTWARTANAIIERLEA